MHTASAATQQYELRMTRSRSARRAVTLVEALIAATILGVVSASAMLPFVAGSQQVRETARLEQAMVLAQALMEEVMSRPFFEPSDRTASPGPGAGESPRPYFNNADDFHGYSETTNDLRDYQYAVVTDPEFSSLRRTVSIQYVSFPGLSQAATDTNMIVRVEVAVYDGTSLLCTLDRIAASED